MEGLFFLFYSFVRVPWYLCCVCQGEWNKLGAFSGEFSDSHSPSIREEGTWRGCWGRVGRFFSGSEAGW